MKLISPRPSASIKMNAPRFKVGDVINSSLSSQQTVEEIRIGVESDFVGKVCNFTGEMCYVLRYVYGKRNTVLFGVACVDSDHHLKGDELFEAYDKIQAEYR
jgi:hypothetical protein